MTDISSGNINIFNSLIKNASRIVIVSHTKPDGDALGASVAMYHFLRMEGKEHVTMIFPDALPDNLGFILDESSWKDVTIHSEDPGKAERLVSECSLMICLDFNAFHRTDRLEDILATSAADKILIDHHLNPDRSKFTLSFSQTMVSSTCELLYMILMATPQIGNNAASLPQKAAYAMMCGMTTDTNNFANSTFPSTLAMASELIAAGVDRDLILSNLYNRFSESRLRLMGHMLKDLLTITENGVAYMVLDQETLLRYNIHEGDTEGFVNLPLSIEKVRMSLLLKEDGQKVRVSIRSRKGVSANRCARLHFNGGGHENAAGGRLMIPEDIKGISDAAAYIEQHTDIFFNDDRNTTDE